MGDPIVTIVKKKMAHPLKKSDEPGEEFSG